jgi:hypothetical protein
VKYTKGTCFDVHCGDQTEGVPVLSMPVIERTANVIRKHYEFGKRIKEANF